MQEPRREILGPLKAGDTLGLRRWIILPVALAMLGIMIFGALFQHRQSQEQPRREMEQLMIRGRAAWSRMVAGEARMLRAHLDYLAADPALIAARREGDPEQLFVPARPLFDRLRQQDKISHFYFFLPLSIGHSSFCS